MSKFCVFKRICQTRVPKLTSYTQTSQMHGGDLNNEIHTQPRCQKMLCFVLKVPETGEQGTERQSHPNVTGHFPGNKSGSLKANKTHTYTCKRPRRTQAVCAWTSSCMAPLFHPDPSDVSHAGGLLYKHVEKETFHRQKSQPANMLHLH